MRVNPTADRKTFSYFISAAPLGSIEELPGKSCAEIKASEGKAMTYGIHWIYSDENFDRAIQATCEGNSLSINQYIYLRVRDCCECFVFKYTHALTVQ